MGVARLVREAAALGVVARTLVICPAPVKERGDLAEIFHEAETRCAGLAAQMERFATESGAAFLDAGAHVSVDELDGVHLSAGSHKVLGHVVAQKVQELLS